jgi:adenylate kinase family enzyme
MNDVIFLFGPSCSGKSTLGKALCNSLGRQWTYIDRDDLIEQNLCTDSTANVALEEKIKSIRQNIIIDAQIPWRKKRKGEFYFMVLPPLKILLERNEKRDRQLQRSEQRAYYARKYVLETYNALVNIDKSEFNYCFDSSMESVQDEVNTTRSLIDIKA